MPVVLQEFWDLILVAVAGLVYIIRSEGKTNMLAKDVERLWKQRDEDKFSAQKSREETHQMLKDMNDKLDRLIERQVR